MRAVKGLIDFFLKGRTDAADWKDDIGEMVRPAEEARAELPRPVSDEAIERGRAARQGPCGTCGGSGWADYPGDGGTVCRPDRDGDG